MVLAETFGNFALAIAVRVLGLRDLGPALSPFNAFLHPVNGIETLPLRMQRHCDNALARWPPTCNDPPGRGLGELSGPGDATSYHAARPALFAAIGAGAVFTIGLKGGYEAGVKLVSNLTSCSRISPISATPAR